MKKWRRKKAISLMLAVALMLTSCTSRYSHRTTSMDYYSQSQPGALDGVIEFSSNVLKVTAAIALLVLVEYARIKAHGDHRHYHDY